MKKSQIFLNLFFIILSALIVIPFLLVLAISFSRESDILSSGYSLIPKHIDLSAYRYVLKNSETVVNAYTTTIVFSVLTMVLSTFLCCLAAYPLSRSEYKHKRGVSFYLFFTMLFGGGLVPTYILITQYLHLSNNIWVYVLPSLISPWYIFMIRSFMQGIPSEITEAAVVDGANEFEIFFKFILPLSKPVIATVALLTFLAKWNDWMTSMLYVDDVKLQSLQYMLQKILNNIELLRQQQMGGTVQTIDMVNVPSETARMAMAIIVAGPALVVFPFFQKYFAKGMTVGSVKG